MVAQFIASIGMHEHVARSVIERKPTPDVGKLRWRKRDLVAPTWMGSDLSLVKAAHLNPIAKLRGCYFAKFPGRIATGRIEIDMRMPARDARYIEMRHCWSPWFPRKSLRSIRLQFKLSTLNCKFVGVAKRPEATLTGQRLSSIPTRRTLACPAQAVENIL